MIKVICTDEKSKLKEIKGGIFADRSITWRRDYKAGVTGATSKIEKLPVIEVYPDEQYQDILGFGGAFTDAACYLINGLEEDEKERLLQNLFSPEEMNFSVGRTTVAQCDFGRVCYSYNDTPDDLNMDNFSTDYDREYIIPVIKRAQKINPELFLLASPWSPPGWMKTGGLMTGGWMREKYLGAFAKYYLKYLQEYAQAGIRIHALTAQNETETDQLSQMPACYWHPEHEAAFVKHFMRPLLKENGLESLEIWLLDHNYIMWQRVKWMLDELDIKNQVQGIAYHPYEGSPKSMSWVHDVHPEIDAHMTEVGGATANLTATDICEFAVRFNEILQNWARSIFCWNLALDENGKPNIGPFFGRAGVVEIHSETGEIQYNDQYWALAHYSKFIRRGARRIGSKCDHPHISQCAFRNENGAFVVVVSNTGPKEDVSLDIGSRYAMIEIPEMSVCTLVFD